MTVAYGYAMLYNLQFKEIKLYKVQLESRYCYISKRLVVTMKKSQLLPLLYDIKQINHANGPTHSLPSSEACGPYVGKLVGA